MFPRRIFQTWKTHNVPKHWQSYQDSWKRNHSDWLYVLQNDEENRNFILTHFHSCIDVYDQLPFNINRVDFVRYAYLYVHGGVYADMDCESIKSLEPLLCSLEKKKEISIVLSYDSLAHLECAFMISKPRQKFWLKVMDSIRDGLTCPASTLQFYSYVSSSMYILHLTGPCRLELMVKQQQQPDGIKIFPSDYFFPKQWNDTKHVQGKDIATTNTYVVHHMTGSWISSYEKVGFEMVKFISTLQWGWYLLLLVVIVMFIIILRNFF